MDPEAHEDVQNDSKMESPAPVATEPEKGGFEANGNAPDSEQVMEQTCFQNSDSTVQNSDDPDKSVHENEGTDGEPKRVKRDREAEQYRKLFIGGLNLSTTDEGLSQFFSQWGEVVDCIVMRDPQSKRSRGFGFVTYSDNSMIDNAMAARPHIIDSKEVESKRAVPREFSGKFENHVSVKKLYVSGIKEEHTDDMLKDHFSAFGNVEGVEIIVDKNTGKKRGFAFVLFDDYDSVDKCVLQRSHMVDGKRCDVKKALSKEEMADAEARNRDRNQRQARSRGGDERWGGGGAGGYGSYGNEYGFGGGPPQWNNNWGNGGWAGGGGGAGYNQGWGGGGGYSGGRGGGYGGSGWGNQGYGSQGNWGSGGQWNQGYDSSWRGSY